MSNVIQMTSMRRKRIVIQAALAAPVLAGLMFMAWKAFAPVDRASAQEAIALQRLAPISPVVCGAADKAKAAPERFSKDEYAHAVMVAASECRSFLKTSDGIPGTLKEACGTALDLEPKL